ncbi:MAG: MerR family transcriptional regulator [Spirochaetales bacterium]|nr:MerR family transcriptional regulator [Spirochaetales bacterium]
MTDEREETSLSVGETAERTGLSAHTLRYYEKIGLMNPISRASNGTRCYSADDVGWIEFLKCLRATGMPIGMMKRYMDYQRRGDGSIGNRVRILREHRDAVVERLDEMRRYLEKIDSKIAYYVEEERKYET